VFRVFRGLLPQRHSREKMLEWGWSGFSLNV